MADIESLNLRRALRDNDNAGVTPLEMLKDVVQRLESGDLEASKAFVMLADEDGGPLVSCSADVTTAELVTLVEVVKIGALQRRGWLK